MAKRDNSPKRKATKRRLTANQEEWLHQLRNLKRRIKALEKSGLIVDYELPEIPKRVTKRDIEKIKGLRRPQLIDLPQRTIDIIEPDVVRISDVELSQLEAYIEEYSPVRNVGIHNEAKAKLKAVLEQRIAESGRNVVAAQLERSADADMIAKSILYASDQEAIDRKLATFVSAVFGRALSLQELQEIQSYNEANESFE